jgi:glycosyltransferase involved in cell wall biosynthesis
MEKALVSVVIPTYNRAHLVGEAIQSALDQTYPNCEVIVIDDGSQDHTEEMIRTRFGGNSRVRCFRQENRGVSAARNRALSEARGEFIAFLDSDDSWLPGKLELQVACLRFLPTAGMIWTDMEAVDGQGKTIFPTYLRRMYSTYRFFPTPQDLFTAEHRLDQVVSGGLAGFSADVRLFCGDIYASMVLGNLVHTSTVLIRRERQQQVGLFAEDYRTGEDYPFHLRTSRVGPVAFVDVSTTRYRIGQGDALTAPQYSFGLAKAYVDTLEESLSKDGDRLRLPAGRLDDCLASAYAWLGREYLKQMDAPHARAYLRKSLGHRLFQPRTILRLFFSCLPELLRHRSIIHSTSHRDAPSVVTKT